MQVTWYRFSKTKGGTLSNPCIDVLQHLPGTSLPTQIQLSLFFPLPEVESSPFKITQISTSQFGLALIVDKTIFFSLKTMQTWKSILCSSPIASTCFMNRGSHFVCLDKNGILTVIDVPHFCTALKTEQFKNQLFGKR